MYLFGGNQCFDNNKKCFYFLDLKTFKWKAVSPKGDIPESRDDHSAVIYDGSMIIFGGFVDG